MAANGISTLSTKRARQIAKLDLAATKRAADGNTRATYDLTQLPTVYAEGDNDTNAVVDNPNTGGLVTGRPWVETPVVSYAVVPRQLTVDEGLGNATVFDITTTGVSDGTTLYFTVTGTVTGADFTGGSLPSGSTVITDGVSAVSFGLVEDSLTEGAENYALELRTGSTSGPVVATSAFVTVNDTSTTPDVVTRNLQLYLNAADTDSYPGTGTTWTDLSTNAYATTLIDAPTFNTTHFTFDGVNDYVDTNQSLASESFSVGAWFRTTNTGINMMLSKETTAGRPWNYRLWLNGGELRGDMGQGVSTPEIVFDGGYNDGEWYFGMFTRDDDNWHLYVNGVEVATRTDPLTGTVSNSQELWIGRSAFTSGGTNPTGSYPYNGDIGQVFIYDAVLTAAEVLQNYNATKATYEPTVVAWSDNTYFDSFTSQSGVTDTDGIDTNNLCWQLYYAHTALTIPADGVDRLGINTYRNGSNTIAWRYAVSTQDDTLGSFAADQQFATQTFSYTAGGFNEQPADSAVSIPANRYFLIGVTSGPFYRTSKLLANSRTAYVNDSPVVTVFNTYYEGARIGGPTSGIPTDLGGSATFTKHTDRVSVTSVKFEL